MAHDQALLIFAVDYLKYSTTILKIHLSRGCTHTHTHTKSLKTIKILPKSSLFDLKSFTRLETTVWVIAKSPRVKKKPKRKAHGFIPLNSTIVKKNNVL